MMILYTVSNHTMRAILTEDNLGSHEEFLKKLKRRPFKKDITFDDAHRFLTSSRVGFTVLSNGSHFHFRKDGVRITIARKNLEAYNIKQILEALQTLGIDID